MAIGYIRFFSYLK